MPTLASANLPDRASKFTQGAASNTNKPPTLLESLRASVIPTQFPQPIGARNAGLLNAWQTWLQRRPDGSETVAINDWINGVTCRLDDAVRMFRHALQTDPSWRNGRAAIAGGERAGTAVITMGAAPLMFWCRAHVLIELTPALEQQLTHSDIGDDLPVCLFRAPAPACFLRFGQIFQDAIISAPEHTATEKRHLTGVYLFDGRNSGARSIDLVCVFLLPQVGVYSTRTIELVFYDENESVLAQIRRACQIPELRPHLVSIIQTVAKVFFYYQQPGVPHVTESDYTAAQHQLARRSGKKATKVLRRITNLYDRVVLGPAEFVQRQHGELTPHLRRGHFRLQPYGPECSLRKVIFLAPTWVGADRMLNH